MQSNKNVILVEDPHVVNDNFSLTPRFVGANPTYKVQGGYAKPDRYSISKMSSLRDQEAALMQDLIYVLTGLEGYYIRYSDQFEFESLSQRILGPDYVIDTHIDASFKDIARRLNRMGKIYYSLKSFVEVYNNLIYGRVMQSFCAEIQVHLKQYESVIVEIENNFKHDPRYTLTLLEQRINTNDPVSQPSKLQRLYEIVQQIHGENEKRASNSKLDEMRFDSIMASLKDDHYTGTLDGVITDSVNSRFVKGAVVLSIVQNSVDQFKGNRAVYNFLVQLFDRVSLCYVEMLNKWLQLGVVDDPYDEFLIKETKCSPRAKYDHLQWTDKFTIRRDGLLKQFRSSDIQREIILTGKYLSVLRECTDTGSLEPCDTQVTSLQSSDLQILVDEAYKRSNRYIISMFFQGYHLDQWILSLNRYFLITDGSCFGDFLDTSFHELRRSADHSSLSTLTRNYKRAYSEDKAAVDTCRLVYNLITPVVLKETFINELREILKTQTADADQVFATTNLDSLRELLRSTIEANTATLQNELFTPQNKVDKYAVHSFAIDIEVPFPLSLILTKSQVFEYQLLYRQQLLQRFVEKDLLTSWYEICRQKFWCWNYSDPRINNWIDRCRFLHSKMSDFNGVLNFYFNFHVIDVNWKKVSDVLAHVDDGSVTLETIYSTVKNFLSTVLNDSMLTKLKLIQALYQIFTIVALFNNLLMTMEKTLILMDETLFEDEQSKVDVQFDADQNEVRFEKMHEALESYITAFDAKTEEFTALLKRYGELDSPALLVLEGELEQTLH